MAFIAILLCVAGLGVKILLRRHGEFKRHCSSVDPYTGEGHGCQCAARQVCKEQQEHPYQPLDVNSELLSEAGVENN